MKNNFNKNIRFIISYIIAYFFICTGFVHRAKKKAKSGTFITSIYFHDPDKNLFEGCIQWLIKNNYVFISIDDLVEILEKRKDLPKQSVLITLDDAYRNNIPNVVSVAEQYNIPITIFAPTDSIETGEYWASLVYKGIQYTSKEFKRIDDFKKIPEWKRKEQINLIKQNIKVEREAMTVEELKTISKSHLIGIGSHSVNHPSTINCSDGELKFELRVSKEKLESWIGKEIKYFAYPSGDFNERDKIYLKKYNYKLAFTTVPKPIYPDNYNYYELPRYCIIPNASFAENICRMLGIWQPFFLWFSKK